MINFKVILRPLLRAYLKLFTYLVLIIRRPFIIAVAGSMNKHFTKQAITNGLQESGFSVRAGRRGYNTDIGLPLAILNLASGYNSYKNWKHAIINAPKAIFKKTEKILVLELGISEPQDMEYLLSIVKPNIVVLTDITQRHIENFKKISNITGEYEFLVKSLKPLNLIVANSDNKIIDVIIKNSKAEVKTFGYNNDAIMNIRSIEVRETGQDVIIKSNSSDISISMNKFGAHHAHAHCANLLIQQYLQKNEKLKKTKLA